MPEAIAVIGAAGVSGIDLLATLNRSGARTRALVHSEDGAERANGAGADETVTIDLADPTSVTDALAGCKAAYMIPPSLHPQEGEFAKRAVLAAEHAGVTRFVYVSVLHPYTPSMRHHIRKAEAEAALRHSSLRWTILQPTMYAQVVWAMFGGGAPGVVRVPFDPESVFTLIDLADLSEIGRKVLIDDRHAYACYELAGDSATMADHIATAARVRGVELRPERIPPGSVPIPPRFADTPSSADDMRAMFDEYDQYGLRGNPTVLTTLLGRAPRTFEDVARRMKSAT